MTGRYEIMLGGKSIGWMEVQQEGLYYRFCCRCDLTGSVIYKIIADCGGEKRNLGIVVPMGGRFGLDTKVAVKYFQKAEPHFCAVPRHQSIEGKFIPVYPEEPFAYLSKLQKAYLEKRNGQIGVVIH